jgi:hypothetical protein
MFKRAFSIFFLTYTFLTPAMAVTEFNPGTVVDPINQSGQFTVSIPQVNTSGIPVAAQAGTELFKTKGTPVIISTVASNVPWWALTTGTGYLLIAHFDPTIPFATALSGGLGYGAGQEIGTITNAMSPTIARASQLALLATFLGTSLYSGNALISDAFMAATQALGLQTALALSAHYFSGSKTSAATQNENSGILNNIKIALGSGLGDVLHVHAVAAFLNLLGNVSTATLMHILLYEQAYRLAMAGSHAAQQLFSTQNTPQKEVEKQKPVSKKERPIVTIM